MVGKLKEDLTATIKELYDFCKKKKKTGENQVFFKAFVEEYEKRIKAKLPKSLMYLL